MPVLLQFRLFFLNKTGRHLCRTGNHAECLSTKAVAVKYESSSWCLLFVENLPLENIPICISSVVERMSRITKYCPRASSWVAISFNTTIRGTSTLLDPSRYDVWWDIVLFHRRSTTFSMYPNGCSFGAYINGLFRRVVDLCLTKHPSPFSGVVWCHALYHSNVSTTRSVPDMSREASSPGSTCTTSRAAPLGLTTVA